MSPIDSLQDLRNWLTDNGINADTWGHGQAKTDTDLWHEISVGESRLVNGPPRRLVSIVQVIVRRGNLKLVEAEQEFGDGRTRSRNLPPSDKIHPDEDYGEAAVRCLHEELGVDRRDVILVEGSYQREEKTAHSRSYPGLPTMYTFHTMQAIVSGLPETDFWRDNAAFDEQGDPIRRHRWTWRPTNH